MGKPIEEKRVPVSMRLRKSVYYAIGMAAKSERVTTGEWLEKLAIPAIPAAFRKGIKS